MAQIVHRVCIRFAVLLKIVIVGDLAANGALFLAIRQSNPSMCRIVKPSDSTAAFADASVPIVKFLCSVLNAFRATFRTPLTAVVLFDILPVMPLVPLCAAPPANATVPVVMAILIADRSAAYALAPVK
jgi:hypothetical protein